MSQTITFGPLAGKNVGDAPFTLSATASSGLTVSYTSSNPAVATVSGNTVTIVGAGSTTITASQAGDATYSAATPVPQNLTVTRLVRRSPSARWQPRPMAVHHLPLAPRQPAVCRLHTQAAILLLPPSAAAPSPSSVQAQPPSLPTRLVTPPTAQQLQYPRP